MFDDTTAGQRDAINERLDEGDRRMSAMESRLSAIEGNLKANTEATTRIERNTAAMVEWSHAFEGALKVLEGIARLAKPIGVIVAVFTAIAGFYLALKGGNRP